MAVSWASLLGLVCSLCIITKVQCRVFQGPQNATYIEGDLVVLQCTLDGLPTDVSPSWYDVERGALLFRGNDFFGNSRTYSNFRLEDPGSPINFNLVIEKIRLQDASLYECSTRTEDRQRAWITIEVEPEVVMRPPAPNFVLGEEVIFICSAIGSKPATNITWYIDDVIMNEECHWTKSRSDGKFDTDSVLTFLLSEADIGKVLRCESNGHIAVSPQSSNSVLVQLQPVQESSPCFTMNVYLFLGGGVVVTSAVTALVTILFATCISKRRRKVSRRPQCSGMIANHRSVQGRRNSGLELLPMTSSEFDIVGPPVKPGSLLRKSGCTMAHYSYPTTVSGTSHHKDVSEEYMNITKRYNLRGSREEQEKYGSRQNGHISCKWALDCGIKDGPRRKAHMEMKVDLDYDKVWSDGQKSEKGHYVDMR